MNLAVELGREELRDYVTRFGNVEHVRVDTERSKVGREWYVVFATKRIGETKWWNMKIEVYGDEFACDPYGGWRDWLKETHVKITELYEA